ncbi:MAG: AtpZ/AtpI family protein [Moheibacter sp.]
MAEENKNKNVNKYLQLTGIAFQMMAVMFMFIWLGRKADEMWNSSDKKYFTMLAALLGLVASLYLTLRQLKRMQ